MGNSCKINVDVVVPKQDSKPPLNSTNSIHITKVRFVSKVSFYSYLSFTKNEPRSHVCPDNPLNEYHIEVPCSCLRSPSPDAVAPPKTMFDKLNKEQLNDMIITDMTQSAIFIRHIPDHLMEAKDKMDHFLYEDLHRRSNSYSIIPLVQLD